MKRLIFFLTNIFCLWLFSDAQTIEKGIYFGNGNTDFMIVTDDTICYRLQTSFGMVYNTIGIGPYIYKNGLLTIQSSEKIFEVTTKISITQREDSITTFRILDYDGTPLSDIGVSFEERQTQKDSFWKRLIKCFRKRVNDKAGIITTVTDNNGFVSETILKSVLDKQLLIKCYDFGLAEMRTDICIKKGYDYVMKSGIPNSIPCSVGKIGCHCFNINILEDGTLEHIVTNPGYPNQPDTTYLFLHSKECSIDMDWFKKNTKTSHNSMSVRTTKLR